MAETMEIPLTRGQVAIIDVDDWHLIKDYKWYAYWNPSKKGYYALTSIEGESIGMHRLILGAKKGQMVDHIDGRGLNNARSNLRIVTAQQNMMNRRTSTNNTSGVPGVVFHKKANKWMASIYANGKSMYLGIFEKFEDAVDVRRKAEDKYYGEYAWRSENFKEEYVAPVPRDTIVVLWYLLGYGEVYVVPLTRGKYSIIDIESYDKVAPYMWYSTPDEYVRGTVDKKQVALHRHLMNPKEGFVVDHINGDPSDNRISNLRCITQQQNIWNSRRNTNVAEYKNISKIGNRWQLRMSINGKETYLGLFKTVHEAIEAREVAYNLYRDEHTQKN